MDNSNLILEGVQLMFIGMSMVFVFLSILVLCMGFMQKLFVGSEPKKTFNLSHQQVSNEEIAAISAAVHSFRHKNSQD